MNNAITQYIVVFFEFALTYPYKWDTSLSHVFSMTCISLFCTFLIMPVVTVKLHNKVKRRYVSINNKLSYTMLFDIFKLHNFKQLVAKQFERGWSRSFSCTVNATIPCSLVAMRRLDTPLLSTVSACNSDTSTSAIFSQTGNRTKVTYNIKRVSRYLIDFFAAIQTGNHFSCFSQCRYVFTCMLSGTFARAEVPFFLSYQKRFLIETFATVVAVHEDARKLWIIDALMSGIVARLATKLSRRLIIILICIKTFPAILTRKGLFFRLCSTNCFIALTTAILRSLIFCLKYFPAMLASEGVFIHTPIITDEVAF